MNAYEEAIAVKAMLDRGLTEQGAAQALGWPAQRVAARVKLLELPEKAQATVGAGVLPLSYVDTLRAIRQVSAEVLELLVDFVDANEGYVDQLQRDVPRLLRAAIRETDSKVFVATLTNIDAHQIEALRLAKGSVAGYQGVAELNKKINPYSYGSPSIRFADAEVDQARTAGGTCGYYVPADKRIVIDSTMASNARVSVLCHELAHALVRADRQDEDPQLHYASEDLVVESVAFTVVRSLGINASVSTTLSSSEP